MPASGPLYHDIRAHLDRRCAAPDLPPASAERLALLGTGLIAAQRCVLAKVAAHLDALALSAARCDAPLLATAIDWRQAHDGQGRLVLIIDESSQRDRLHLLRLSLPDRGGSLPLA